MQRKRHGLLKVLLLRAAGNTVCTDTAVVRFDKSPLVGMVTGLCSGQGVCGVSNLTL